MKNILNYLGLAVILILAGCSDSDNRTPSPTVDGPAVHFAVDDNGARQEISQADQTSIGIVLYRTNQGSDAVSVPLSLTDESELFSIPASVTIPANSDKVTVPVSFDPESLELGVFYDLTLAISSESITTPYGPSYIGFTAGRPLVWEAWANGLLSSEFFEFEDEAIVLQKAKGVNRFRFAAPFTNNYPFVFNWDIDEQDTAIMPIGTALTVSGIPVIRQNSGEPYDDTSHIFLLTDYNGESTYYDPETQLLTILSMYYVFTTDGEGLGGFGWFSDYFEITEFLQDNPWE